jgi:hypothetical protein
MSSNDSNNDRERSVVSPSVELSAHSIAGGEHHNMVGSYKDWILANVKILYGPNPTRDVVYGLNTTHPVGHNVRSAYLVA